MPSHAHDQYFYGKTLNGYEGNDNIVIYEANIERSGTGYVYNEYQKTGNTGGGAAHNNMPPYIAVYVWKRIA